MITERLELAGDFKIALKPTTPREIRDLILRDHYGKMASVVITPTWQPDVTNDEDALFATSIYTGVAIGDRTVRPAQLNGIGYSALITSYNNRFTRKPGGTTSDPWNYNALYLDDALDTAGPASGSEAIINGGNGISAGTLAHTTQVLTSTWVQPYGRLTRQEAFQNVVRLFAAYWRLNHDRTLDATPTEGDIFKTTPEVLITNGGIGSREPDMTVLPGEIKASRNNENYATDVELYDESDFGTRGTGSPTGATALYYTDVALAYHKSAYIEVVNDDRASSGQLDDEAALLADSWYGEAARIRVSCDVATPRRFMEPGDHILVYSPEELVLDEANPILALGSWIYPLEVRLLAMSWPLLPRYGVWHISTDSARTVTDISPYVVRETGPVQLEVGAPIPKTGLTHAWELRQRTKT